MRSVLFAAAALLGGAAQAAELAPLEGVRHEFGGAASALVCYTPEADGFHVVATVQSSAAVTRLSATLVAGQGMAVSVPRGLGQAPAELLITRNGDRLDVSQSATVAAAD